MIQNVIAIIVSVILFGFVLTGLILLIKFIGFFTGKRGEKDDDGFYTLDE